MNASTNNTINTGSNPMIRSLMLKDWHFNKNILMAFATVGLISVAMLLFENSLFYVGLVLLLSMVILIGALLVFNTVINEKKNQTLIFIMSLPINCTDYTKAKMLFNMICYGLAWLLLTISTLLVIDHASHIPDGLMPFALIILLELMVTYLLILAIALVTESELYSIVVMTITNIGISLFMFFISNIDDIGQYMQDAQAHWNTTAMSIIGLELLSANLIIGTTLYLQSRKKDVI